MMISPYSRAGYQKPETDPEAQRARAKLAAIKDRNAHAVAHVAKLNGDWAPLGQLLKGLDRFVIGGGPKTAFTGKVPELVDATRKPWHRRKPLRIVATASTSCTPLSPTSFRVVRGGCRGTGDSQDHHSGNCPG
jgi:hypothetical protein